MVLREWLLDAVMAGHTSFDERRWHFSIFMIPMLLAICFCRRWGIGGELPVPRDVSFVAVLSRNTEHLRRLLVSQAHNPPLPVHEGGSESPQP